ncbi:Kri1-like, C-terminal [Kalmanozyma brasiliensis GHG001]|uniref:Kri1-like C-terminal domain-containing protein n=1 Tax=Kalmanozyma brasiliensis (strain GHG001) TaxID=1365824 RepID=V5EV43_KALBG|nr:Kri1-like, C-terminal [Kalmanozyma brasiliensis GHG001]EST09320.1 Kri1-like, C-terminal [Kalmanozyma brasiliensis GHG001]
MLQPKMELFNDDSSPANLDIRTRPEESLNHFTINKDFAERYLHNKQRAELHQLEAKYGKDALASDDDEETDSESDVTEDEDGDQVNAHVDAAILRTLQRIRNKDAALYDSKTDVFAQEAERAERAARVAGPAGAKKGTTKKDKKVTLQDYQRSRVQELMETAEDPAAALADATTSDRVKGIINEDEGMPFAQEQEELRKEVSQAFHAGVDAEDDLFVKRSEASNGNGSSYREAVIASLGPNADENTIRQAIRNEASTSTSVLADANDEKKNEDFLLNYILNRGWIDTAAEERPVKPRLTKAVLQAKDDAEPSSSNGDGQAYGRDWEAEAADLESEASFDSMADAFETAYNFRFEQGVESLTIPTYSRQPKDSARREDNSRKRKREERAARKDEERRLKMQELARLKNLKRQEIVDKLKKLKEATGSTLEGLDLEGDFDAEAHDRAMEKAFGDGFDGGEDDEKPSWDDDIEIDDIIKEHEASVGGGKGKKKAKQSHVDEDKIEMDADFLDGDAGDNDGTAAAGSKEAALRARLADKKLSKKDRKKLKKKLKAALSKSSSAPNGDESDSDADDDDGVEVSAMDASAPAASSTDKKAMAKDMIDSYYNLDYEDMIGDLPTRFKYTQVAPADFGMSAVDILLADDDQLNNVVGLKNLQPYRRGKNRPLDLGKKLGQFRKDVYGNTSRTSDGTEKTQKKRLGKKERNRLKAAEETGGKE